jgi:type VI secretion system protein ImpH
VPQALQTLLKAAPRINFFRFCELLELSAPRDFALGAADTPACEPVRFRSRQQLGFPAREIAAVESYPDDLAAPPTLRTTFLGLYGVDAPLPAYFIDEIAQHRDGAQPLAALLDLFHHRIVTQFYRIWRKYRYPVGFQPDGSDATSRYLLSLAGLGMGSPAAARTIGTRACLSMLGLVSQRTRTAEGLAGVLQHVVPQARIHIEEFHPDWVELSRPQALPLSTPLGNHCLLGYGFYDRAHTVRIAFEPDTRAMLLSLIPGGTVYREITALLQFYLGYTTQARLEMHVQPELIPLPRLNSDQVRLGYTTLFSLPNRAVTRAQQQCVRIQLGKWDGHLRH